MPMSRAVKEQEVAGYKKNFADNEIFVIARNDGLTVAQMTELRAKIREQGASFKITKNRLAKIALEGSDIAGIGDMLKGPVGVAASNELSVTKAVYEFAKKNDRLVIIGGAMGSEVLDKAGIEKLAKLPSLDEVRGMLVGLLQAPGAQLARLAQAYADKGGASGEAPAAAAEAPAAEAPAAEEAAPAADAPPAEPQA